MLVEKSLDHRSPVWILMGVTQNKDIGNQIVVELKTICTGRSKRVTRIFISIFET